METTRWDPLQSINRESLSVGARSGLCPFISFPFGRPHAALGPGRGAQAEQMLLLRADRTVLSGEDLPPGSFQLPWPTGQRSIDWKPWRSSPSVLFCLFENTPSPGSLGKQDAVK